MDLVRPERQTLLFSATFKKRIDEMTIQFLCWFFWMMFVSSQIRFVVDLVRPERQTLLFSATLKKRIREMTTQFLCCLFLYVLFFHLRYGMPWISCNPRDKRSCFPRFVRSRFVKWRHNFCVACFCIFYFSTSDTVYHGSRATWETDALVFCDF